MLNKIFTAITAISLKAGIRGISRTKEGSASAGGLFWNNRLESYFIISYKIKLRFYQLIILYELLDNNKFISNYKPSWYKNL